MKPNHINAEPFEPADPDSCMSGSVELSELALLIDAIPREYREDVLLAVLYLAESDILAQSHFVGLYRERLQDCLVEKTGTIHDLSALRQLGRIAIQRRLSLFKSAEDPAQVTVALCGLLDFLINAL